MGFILFLILSLPFSALSSTIDRSLSFYYDNDSFLKTDRSHTAATKITWILPGSGELNKSSLLRILPFRRGKDFTDRVALSLGGEMFTPDNITISSLILEDRPYSGYNYFSAAFIGRSENVFESFEVSLGLTGPLTLTAQIQKIVHRIVGAKRPEGWDNQLDNELILQVYYDRIWKEHPAGPGKGLRREILPRMSAGLGNGLIYGALGLFARAGWNIPNDFGPPVNRPAGLRGVSPVCKGKGGFYGFLSLDAFVNIRNIFLDGNTFADSHSVDKYMFTIDLNWGIVARFSKFQFSVTHTLWTKRYILESFNHQFLRLSLSYLY